MGSETRKFELELEDFLGNRTVCVANGTAALQLSLQALGVQKGDEVLVPSLTYVATFQAIAATGAKAIPCDISRDNLCIDLNDAAKKVTRNTKAIVPVHFSGELMDRVELRNFTKKHSLRIVEDAAHAFGSLEINSKTIEPIDLIAFSFDGIKNLTAGEGGCVIGSNSGLLDYVADARLLGVLGDSQKRYSGERSWEFDVKFMGWRYHMSDVMAAIGRAQLRKFHKLSKKRRLLAKFYDDLLRGTAVETFKRDYDRTVPHIFPVLLPDGVDRNRLIHQLKDLGIQTGIHYKPNHHLTFFSQGEGLPVTDSIHTRLLSLPLHPGLNEQKQRFVVSSLLSLLA